MKLKTIEKKCPKATAMFISKQKDAVIWSAVFYLPADVRYYWKEITDFMDKQEIFITIDMPCDEINFYVWDGLNGKHESDYNLSRDQAETLAIEKAFQILEGRLQEGGK